jgi:hypothetical protein
MSAEHKKSFKLPGDPIRIQICRLDDHEAALMKKANEGMGFIPYEHLGWMCVDVMGHGCLWQARDAIFRPVSDGIYHFKKDEKGNAYCEGPY